MYKNNPNALEELKEQGSIIKKNSPGDTKRKVHLPFNLNGYSQ